MTDMVILGITSGDRCMVESKRCNRTCISTNSTPCQRVAAPHRVHVMGWRDVGATAQKLCALQRTACWRHSAVWDYMCVTLTRFFAPCFDDVELGAKLLHAAARCCRWNGSKHYLLELQERGIPIVPSAIVDDADPSADHLRAASTRSVSRRLAARVQAGHWCWCVQASVDVAQQFDTAGHVAEPGGARRGAVGRRGCAAVSRVGHGDGRDIAAVCRAQVCARRAQGAGRQATTACS
jgi:hypothetical protein